MPDTLNPEEINALMGAIRDGQVPQGATSSNGAPVTPYDLTSQDRILRGQMPTLDAINEQVASLLASGLAGRTRLGLRVSTSPSALFKFVDFGSVLAAPSVLAVLSLGPGFGHALLVLEPGLAEALLAAALGDRRVKQAESSETRRELTAVEQLVLRRLLTLFTDAMEHTWETVLPFKPKVVRFEIDPRMANIAPPSDVVIASSFQVSSGIEGRLQLVIPFSAVEPAKARLSSPPRMNPGSDARFAAALQRELEQVKVEVRVLLGRTRLTFEKLLELDNGDVLSLTTDEDSPVQILIEGRRKLEGTPKVQHGSMAVELRQGLQPDPNAKASAA